MEPHDADVRLNGSLERRQPHEVPPSLVSAVMREETPGPWYRRGWREWPPGWQVASLGGLIGVVALLLGRGPSSLVAGWLVADTLPASESVTAPVEPSVAALLVIWRVVVEPLVPVAFGIVIVMALACVVIGLLLHYVVSGRTWHR